MRQPLLRRLCTVALAISLPVAAFLLVAAAGGATAYADPGSGAMHETGTTCQSDPVTGGQECFTIDALVNDTITPSGNEAEFFHGTESDTITDSSGNIFVTETFTDSENSVFVQGEPQVGAYKSTDTVSYGSSYGGTTCTYTIFFHFANGTVQFDRENTVCS